MELFVWPSDFGLPSVEPECLQFLACARFCAAPVSIMQHHSPWNTPTGRFPLLKMKETTSVTDFDKFVEFMKKYNKDFLLDGHLNEIENNEMFGYACLIRQKILPAYLYCVWMDDPNFNTITNRWYARNLVFPYNLYYVQKRRVHATNYLRNLCPGKHISNKDIEYAVTREACLCMNLLASKLGDKKYFYGDRPTSLDALVFGYLAPFLKLPLPNDRLQNHLKGCPNLARFVESIISIYLPLTDEELTVQRRSLVEWEMRKSKAQEEIRLEKQDERHQQQHHADEKHEQDEFRIRDKVLFGMGALFITILAALHFGIIKVEVERNNDSMYSNRDAYDQNHDPLVLPEGVDFENAV